MAGRFDYSEFRKLTEQLQKQEADYDKFIRDFITEMGMRLIAKTKALTPVVTGDLRDHWELTKVTKVGDSYQIDMVNPMDYASFVEDGHIQRRRWLPGVWKTSKKGAPTFEYVRGAKTGMMLTYKWIPGQHMARISINKIEKTMQPRFERAFAKFMTK